MIARRGILKVLTGLIAAPAIVKVADLMPINSGLLHGRTGGLVAGDVITFGGAGGPGTRQFVVTGVGNNTLLTIEDITRESVKLFNDKMERQYDDLFAREDARIGDTLRIRMPSDYTVREGQLDVLYGKLQVRPEWWCRSLAEQEPAVTPVQAVALGAAAVVAKNPVVSRRFWK